MSSPDQPTAAELVTAVTEWLSAEVFPTVGEPLRHKVRVAVHTLTIVRRQLELGPALVADHADRLARFGVSDAAELAALIWGGHFDDQIGRLVAVLHDDIVAKLAIDNPRYADDPSSDHPPPRP